MVPDLRGAAEPPDCRSANAPVFFPLKALNAADKVEVGLANAVAANVVVYTT